MKLTKPTTIIPVILILLIVISIFMTPNKTTNSDQITREIDLVQAEEFKSLINSSNPDSQILDIRTPEEVANGKIQGAINLDFYNANFANEIKKLDKTKTYFVYCNSGNRSKSAVGIMKSYGFDSIYELDGGIQAWMSKGFGTCSSC